MNSEQLNFLEDNVARIGQALQEHLMSTRPQAAQSGARQSKRLADAFVGMFVTDADELFDELVATSVDDTALRELDIFEASLAFVSIVRKLFGDDYSSRQVANAVDLLADVVAQAESKTIKIARRFLDLAASKKAMTW